MPKGRCGQPCAKVAKAEVTKRNVNRIQTATDCFGWASVLCEQALSLLVTQKVSSTRISHLNIGARRTSTGQAACLAGVLQLSIVAIIHSCSRADHNDEDYFCTEAAHYINTSAIYFASSRSILNLFFMTDRPRAITQTFSSHIWSQNIVQSVSIGQIMYCGT